MIALRLAVGLFGNLHAGGDEMLAALGFDLVGDMAALRQRRLVARLVEEAELHGVVAVDVLGADLQHRTGADLQDRDRGELARFVVKICVMPTLRPSKPSAMRIAPWIGRVPEGTRSCRGTAAEDNGLGRSYYGWRR